MENNTTNFSKHYKNASPPKETLKVLKYEMFKNAYVNIISVNMLLKIIRLLELFTKLLTERINKKLFLFSNLIQHIKVVDDIFIFICVSFLETLKMQRVVNWL